MKKYILNLSIALGLVLLVSASVNAQPGFDDDVEDTPIDGGISLLVGAGIAYGVKKMHSFKKQSNNHVDQA